MLHFNLQITMIEVPVLFREQMTKYLYIFAGVVLAYMKETNKITVFTSYCFKKLQIKVHRLVR